MDFVAIASLLGSTVLEITTEVWSPRPHNRRGHFDLKIRRWTQEHFYTDCTCLQDGLNEGLGLNFNNVTVVTRNQITNELVGFGN